MRNSVPTSTANLLAATGICRSWNTDRSVSLDSIPLSALSPILRDAENQGGMKPWNGGDRDSVI